MTPTEPPGNLVEPASRSPAPARRLRGLLLNVTMLALALTLAAGLAELLVRLLAPQQVIVIRPDIWQPADSLGWVNRPNVRTSINTGERTTSLFTDAEGFRVGASGRRPAATNVLVIGDSFMEALQVEYEQSFAGLLEARLSGRVGSPVAVWDAGVDGWDPPQYLIRTRQLLEGHRFDLAIVSIYLGNDVVTQRTDYLPPRMPTVRHRFGIPRALRWSAVVDATLYPLNDLLKRHSHLFVLLKNRLQTLRQRTGLTADFFPSELLRSEAGSARWSLTGQICAELAEAAHRHGVPTLFVLLPTPFGVDSAVFHAFARGFGIDTAAVDIDQPDRLMAAALRDHGLRTVAVLPEFRLAHAGGTKLYGTVDRHLTPEGNALLERLVEPAAVAALGPTTGRDPAAALPRR